jgi:23S rRNA (uracil1939-C5)-methyltransferase
VSDDGDATKMETLHLDALDDAGAGMAEADGRRVHVAGALPGETVTARVVHRSVHGRDSWADLHQIIVPSPERVAPVCPAHGRCGGCVLQHLASRGQLAWKRDLVRSALEAAPTGLRLPLIEDCVPSPANLGYRNQAKYVVSRDPSGRTILGAYAPRSHDVIDLAGCRLGEEPQDLVARHLRDLLDLHAVVPFDERTRTGQLRYVVLRTNHAGAVLVALVTGGPDFPAGIAIAEALAAAIPAVVSVVHEINESPGNAIFARATPATAAPAALWGPGVLTERFADIEVKIGARAFLQLNRGVAQAAYAAIRAALAPRPVSRLLDLYAGVGAIGFSLADLAQEIVAVEENPSATAAGADAAARAGLSKVRFVTGPVAASLGSVGPADAIVLNPPRAGAGAQVCGAIAALRPDVIAYLSCNPTTLANDLVALTTADPRLIIESVRPFDMLPHTTHVETLVIVRRSPRST